jgi:crossover junction endodeoxyribonuclease RuvC
MVILGLDISLTGTGICVLDTSLSKKPNSDNFIYFNTIDTKKQFGMQRIEYIRKNINSILDEYQPDLVVIEGYAYGAKGRAVFDLGEIGGVVRHLCYSKGFSYKEVPPTVLKKFVTNNGKADKEEVMLVLESRYGRIFQDDNQADAMGLCLYGLLILN